MNAGKPVAMGLSNLGTIRFRGPCSIAGPRPAFWSAVVQTPLCGGEVNESWRGAHLAAERPGE